MQEIDKIKGIINLFGYNTQNCNIAEQKITDAEKKLGTTLPLLLKQFYLQLGNHSLFQERGVYQYDLVKIDELQINESLTIFKEGKNQSIWICIPEQSLHEINPNVEYWVEGCDPYSGSLLDYLHIVIRANVGAQHNQKLTIQNKSLNPQSLIHQKLEEIIKNTWYGDQKIILDIYSDCQIIHMQKPLELISFIQEFNLEEIKKEVEFHLLSSLQKNDIKAIQSILNDNTLVKYVLNGCYVSSEVLDKYIQQ